MAHGDEGALAASQTLADYKSCRGPRPITVSQIANWQPELPPVHRASSG